MVPFPVLRPSIEGRQCRELSAPVDAPQRYSTQIISLHSQMLEVCVGSDQLSYGDH